MEKVSQFTAYSITKKLEVGQNKELHLHFLQIHWFGLIMPWDGTRPDTGRVSPTALCFQQIMLMAYTRTIPTRHARGNLQPGKCTVSDLREPFRYTGRFHTREHFHDTGTSQHSRHRTGSARHAFPIWDRKRERHRLHDPGYEDIFWRFRAADRRWIWTQFSLTKLARKMWFRVERSKIL